MTNQNNSLPIEQLRIETESGFNWLIEGLDCHRRIAFVSNPGNIGDAMINWACWQYLISKFRQVEICTTKCLPTAEYVFVGGGGNFVEPLYYDTASLVQRLEPHQRIFIFPSTVYGHSEILKSIGTRARIICRDAISFQFVSNHLPAENVYLGHDAAFAIASRLRSEFAERSKKYSASVKLFRSDRERALSEEGELDIMGQYNSDWVDMTLAASVTRVAARYILSFGQIHTDRLHCAILSAVLERETVLYPNSYFKNAAVFEHSLSRIPNVRFQAMQVVKSDVEKDPVLYLRQQGADQ